MYLYIQNINLCDRQEISHGDVWNRPIFCPADSHFSRHTDFSWRRDQKCKIRAEKLHGELNFKENVTFIFRFMKTNNLRPIKLSFNESFKTSSRRCPYYSISLVKLYELLLYMYIKCWTYARKWISHADFEYRQPFCPADSHFSRCTIFSWRRDPKCKIRAEKLHGELKFKENVTFIFRFTKTNRPPSHKIVI